MVEIIIPILNTPIATLLTTCDTYVTCVKDSFTFVFYEDSGKRTTTASHKVDICWWSIMISLALTTYGGCMYCVYVSKQLALTAYFHYRVCIYVHEVVEDFNLLHSVWFFFLASLFSFSFCLL